MVAKAHKGRGGIQIAFHVDIFHMFLLKNRNWLRFTRFWYSLEGLIKDLALWCGLSCVEGGFSVISSSFLNVSVPHDPQDKRALAWQSLYAEPLRLNLEWQDYEISHARHLISTTDLHVSWVLCWVFFISVLACGIFRYSSIFSFNCASPDPLLPFCCRVLLLFLQDLSFSW